LLLVTNVVSEESVDVSVNQPLELYVSSVNVPLIRLLVFGLPLDVQLVPDATLNVTSTSPDAV